MAEHTTSNEASERIRTAIGQVREELPALSNVLNAFEDVLAERAAFKAELPSEQDFAPPSIDPDGFRQGSPAASGSTFHVGLDDLVRAADRLIPALKKGFSKIEEPLTLIHEALRNGKLSEAVGSKEFLEKSDEEIREIIADPGIDPALLRFVAGQLIAPYAEKRAETMTPLPDDLQWLKGYCPLCGSWPSMSILREKEGERWLKCSFCAHEWRYIRTACPFCENDDHNKLEYFYSEDRSRERVEVCHECKRYILAMDLRDRVREVVLEIVPIALVYLDILAQDKGFTPGTASHWNALGNSE